jgi:hypothetical protein
MSLSTTLWLRWFMFMGFLGLFILRPKMTALQGFRRGSYSAGALLLGA